MRRFAPTMRAVLVLTPFLAIVPIGWLAAAWVNEPDSGVAPRGTDWVRWDKHGSTLVADYVFPGSPAAEAGLKAGDEFFMLNYQQHDRLEALQEAIAAVPPGQTRTYYVHRDGRFTRADVRFTRYPAFLYPLSSELWNFSLWGFTFGAFFHLLGLIVVGPLARRSQRARLSLLLLLASSLWIFSTMARLILLGTFGVPAPGSTFSHALSLLALPGAAGWIAFPALLLHKVTHDTQGAADQPPDWARLLIYLPAAALTALILFALTSPTAWPDLLHPLVAPTLFYTCCYVAAAATLVLAYLRLAPTEDSATEGASSVGASSYESHIGTWSHTGSSALLLSALLIAVLVLLFAPFFRPVTAPTTAWLIVGAQLLSIIPIALVTLATLRHGKFSSVLTRAVTYLTSLGAIFFAFVAGSAVIDAYGDLSRTTDLVISGLYVVFLLLIFERLARRLRLYAARFFSTDQQRAREVLSRFQEQMRTILSHEALAQQTAAAIGEAFGARSVRLFIRTSSQADPEADEWITGAYHPEPPYLTQPILESVWPYIQREGRVWARNQELRTSTLPEGRAHMLDERDVALAVPIVGDGAPAGLLTLGPKKQRGAVYNLADLDLLRSLGGQLTLAVERLDLVDRERTLVRASAEAELAALRAQIHPHFLFNALNTIAALIEENPGDAEATVEHLAAIFRHILQTGSQACVPLTNEFALVQHYLSIEQARFGETLVIEDDLPEALSHHPVPAFAVQTLVENAVKHGIARKRGGGRVRVAARPLENGFAEIVVDDTGTGIPALFPENLGPASSVPSPSVEYSASNGAPDFSPGTRRELQATDERSELNSNSGTRNSKLETQNSEPETRHETFFGIGLRNVADRLERLYGRTDLLELTSAPGKGTTARMYLPPAPGSDDDASEDPFRIMRRL